MIYYVATERFSSTINRFLRSHGKELGGCLASLTYEELFFERSAPIGHYIFTDFDRLSRYELECAAHIALTMEEIVPEARILNHPLRALERYPLLVALHKTGINDFTATRLEAGERPPRYPAFIRAEDGYGGPETDILKHNDDFDAALADLKRRGLPLKGRIAIGYAAERAENGYFQKYGAFNIGGEILPYHLMYGRTWVVKTHVKESKWIERRDDDFRFTDPAIAEELAYVRENPHRDVLARAFAVAGIEFGRADYGVINGRVQIYEINTNPSLGGALKNDARWERRTIVRTRLVDAIKKLDAPIRKGPRVRFSETRPRAHNLRLPRWRLPVSVLKKMSGSFRRPANMRKKFQNDSPR